MKAERLLNGVEWEPSALSLFTVFLSWGPIGRKSNITRDACSQFAGHKNSFSHMAVAAIHTLAEAVPSHHQVCDKV